MTTTDMQTQTLTEHETESAAFAMPIGVADLELRDPVDDPNRVRTATIDLSGVGASIQLGGGSETGEVMRLSLGTRTVHVVNAQHRLAANLLVAEINAVGAGQNAAEFAAWLRNAAGVQFIVLSEGPAAEALSMDDVRSMARLTRQPAADRSLRELATLLGRHPEDLINDFRERTGFHDLAGLVDLTTLSVNMMGTMSAKQYSSELGLLIDAVTTVLMVMAGQGEVSVITTSLEPVEQRWMIEAGWPLAETLDNDLAEIIRGSRSRAGRSVPAWVRAHGLWGAVASQRTVSMTNVATHLHRNRLDLGACIPRGRARHHA
jgi:hypothetical protein